ncbi:GntR family transcriptional regulator [Paenibacillus spongiae]|uniref:GntR family transcriptional regulator n=1 Tax=Paenibacillus spongiae TaxID=2909671 RepID=A0ABY5S534_9BACL|nr:GntR family transcriptional regulator [Paenibacillus spongiae]UVI28769.1 GntR family transcriptional regulator [Paenibacillus spongiae]
MSSSNQPLYLQIRTMIRDKIESGELKPGDQIPVEADLVQQFNVSRITIKSALKLLVDEGLVYRTAGKGTFVADPQEPSLFAPSDQESAFKKIGLIGPMTSDAFTLNMLRGIEETCKEHNLILLIRTSFTQSEEKEAIRILRAQGIDGLLIFPVDGEAYSQAILDLKTECFPFVLIDRYLPGIKTNSVYTNNHQGGYLGTEYLFNKGHRQIGIVSTTQSKTASAEDRFAGYLEAARHLGLKIEPAHWLTRIDESSFKEEIPTKEIIREWLSEQKNLTAVFAFSSITAVFVADIAVQLGKKIPEDLAILSFDSPGVQDFNGLYFSCIEQQEYQLGEKAVDLLLQVISDPAHIEQIIIPVTLVEGRST